MRVAHLICLTVLISHASFGSELEASDLVTEIEDADDAPASTTIEYNAVPGFALKQDATSVAGKDNAGCAAVCTAEPTCKSYSYDPKDQSCLWSVDALNFDPAFVMMTKAHHSEDPFKKYRTFQGLTYRAKGWLKVEHKSLKECEELCTASTTCEALSYREDDMLCLLSPKGVHYAPDYTYYEKIGTTSATMPITKVGGAQMASDEASNSEADAATNNAEVQALVTSEEHKLANANEEISQANEIEQKSRSAVSAEEHEMTAAEEKAQKDASEQLQKDENKFSQAQSEKMSQEESTLRLQFASAELKEKADAETTEAGRERERTEKAAADVRGHAAREAARAVAEGAEAAAARVEKAQLDEKANQAQGEIANADEKTQKANLERANAVDQVEATKEVAEKKTVAAEKEIEEKKAALEGKSDHEKEVGYKEIAESKEKATAEAQDRTIEIEQKEQQRATERAEKARESTAQDEQSNKAAIATSNTERQQDEAAKEAEDAKLTEMQKESMLANVQANSVKVQTEVAGEQQKLNAEKALSESEMTFQKNELAEQIRAKMEREAAEEVEQQRENIAREAARRVAEASKDEAERVAQDAVDNTKKKEIEEKSKVEGLEKQVADEKKLEETKTEAEKAEMDKKVQDEKTQAEKEANDIATAAKNEADGIASAAAADAKSKQDKADAEARQTETAAKELGEKQAADVADAAEQASLITTMTIKADESTFVSSGLNPGTESYQDLENQAKSSNDKADADSNAASSAQQAADEAAAAVTAAESKGKELASKSATAQAQAAQSAAQNAQLAASTASTEAATKATTGGRRLLNNRGSSLLGDTDLSKRLSKARMRAVVAMRRLLQTDATTQQIVDGATNAMQQTANAQLTAEQLSAQTSEATTKASVVASQAVNSNEATTKSSEVSTKASSNSQADAAEAETKEVQQKGDSRNAELDAKAASSSAANTAAESQASAETQQAALNAANLLPANTAYGKLPEMNEHKGYLRVQSGGPMEQSAYIKFPVSGIPGIDTIIGANLRLFKTGGGGGPAIIKLSSCTFTRNTLTYTSSETLPQATVSEGVSAEFPEESDMWASIQLKAAMIQNARANGNHLCFEVTGGPKDEPAIISSELTAKPPELKVELQAPPLTQEARAAKLAEHDALQKKLKAENDMEDHLKAKYTDEEKAKELQDKAAALPTRVNEIKAAGTKREQDETQGGAYDVLSAQKESEQTTDIVQKETEETTRIETEENAKMATELTNSGLTGAARQTLQTTLETQTTENIATLVAAMKTRVANEIKTQYMSELSAALENKKAEIATDVANQIAAATGAASTLSDTEMEAVHARVEGRVAQGMVDWKAGKLTDADAPASVHQAQAEAAGNQLTAGMTEQERANMQSKIAQDVDNALPGALQTKVDGKMTEAESQSVQGVEAKLRADAAVQLQADIARDTAGQDAATAAVTKGNLETASSDKLKSDVAMATTASGLIALKAKLQADLTEQLRPGVKAELKAKFTTAELATATKANADAAAAAGAGVDRESTRVGESGPPQTLDLAKTWTATNHQ